MKKETKKMLGYIFLAVIIGLLFVFTVVPNKNQEVDIYAKQSEFQIEEISEKAIVVRIADRDMQNSNSWFHDPAPALIRGTAKAAEKYNIDISRGIPIVAKYGEGSQTSAIIYPIREERR